MINKDSFLVYEINDRLFCDMLKLMSDEISVSEKRSLSSAVTKGLVGFSSKFGITKNLWQAYVANEIITNENPFSKACEVRSLGGGSLFEVAKHDLEFFRGLFFFDVNALCDEIQSDSLRFILDFDQTYDLSSVKNEIQSASVMKLAEDLREGDFFAETVSYYQKNGVGSFGLNKAFKLDENGLLTPIYHTEKIELSDIIGYEWQKAELLKNTTDFVEGRKANNCLLYGDSGTGKSSSIKAVLNEFYPKGLRMIEVYKHQFDKLSSVIEQVRNRNYKFIIYMDDLSFEDTEKEYKYLKAIIEGDLETHPDNVLIYATSNRRHLIREQFSDRNDMDSDLHRSDTMEEKLSLASRFGVSIFYGSPDRKEYHAIVKALSEKYGIEMSEEEIFKEANKWELSHGGMSGRNAKQFVAYLAGRACK